MISPEQLEEIYDMVDGVTFSRAKKNIHRDFSDALMMAELISHYQPKSIELHNYPPSNSIANKVTNWNTLNSKVLKKIGLGVKPELIKAIASATPGAIQELLYAVLLKFQKPEQENTGRERRTMAGGFTEPEEKQQPFTEENIKLHPVRMEAKTDETDDMIRMVEMIDQATLKLQELKVVSRQKDEVIRNLQGQLERILFAQ